MTAPTIAPAITPNVDGENAAKRAIRRASAKVGSRAHALGGSLTRLATDLNEKLKVQVQTGGVTGTWYWDTKRSRHTIALGDRFINTMKAHPCNARSQSGIERARVLFGEQILRHEAWHGRVTVRDLKAVAAQCKTRSIPFLLVNLMEDMRLEHLARQAEGLSFGWWKYMDRPTATCPLTALQDMILNESYYCRSFAYPNPKAKAWADKVSQFAERIRAAADTFVVIDLAQEWLEYWAAEGWGRDKQGVMGNDIHATDRIGADSDGSLLVLDTNRQRTEAAIHTASVNARGNDLPNGSRSPRRDTTERFKSYTGNQPIDARQADEIAQQMREIVARTASQRSARTSVSGSRLHLAGIASHSEQVFRSYGKTGGKPHLVVLMDFSGSMSRDWAQHGRYFAAAVLRLLRNGTITGKMYATGGGYLAEIPAATSDEALNALSPSKQGENIRDSLTALRQELTGANAVVIYTDGELMDGHVDAGEWRRKGVDLVGAVVIPAHKSENFRTTKIAEMTNFFGAPVTAPTGKALAAKLAQYLGQRWR